jgi:UDP-N-acetylmuramyl pentapeptide phosphotransferase/UDP-N-acetylglucosamine-1-phosphate transferase
MNGGTALIVIALCAFCVSMAVVVMSLAYANRRGLLDQPGQRRSHTRPTPRGGGLGIVAAVLLCAMPALALLPGSWPFSTVIVLTFALLAVAAVGWRDDHGDLPALPRFAVHLLASMAIGAMLLWPTAQDHPGSWVWLILIAPVLAGSINAHNFMDGIDAILALQGLFVLGGYAILAHGIGAGALTATCLASGAGCLGFLLFNLPPARIFMGDVGSGTLGLLIAALAGLLVQRAPALLWPCAILSSAFLTDAAMTLASRVLAHKRWYTAHREHLYQWMARAGGGHARTDGAYVLWNLIIAAPAAWTAVNRPAYGLVLCIAVYVLGALVWWGGKRLCLRATRSNRHVVA